MRRITLFSPLASTSIEDFIFSVGAVLKTSGGQYLSDDKIIFSAVQDVFFSFSDAINLNNFEVGGVQRWRVWVDIGRLA